MCWGKDQQLAFEKIKEVILEQSIDGTMLRLKKKKL